MSRAPDPPQPPQSAPQNPHGTPYEQPYEPLLTPGGWRIGGPDWRKPWPKGLMFLTWFGAGFSYHAPGTVGSLNALPMAVLITWLGGKGVLAAVAIIPFILGWVFTARYLRDEPNSPDPQWIVIDEVVGLWITLSVVPLNIIWFAIGFGLFRLFDILKPWPVSWADRKVPGALGIMLDDVLAGLYAAVILLVMQHLWNSFV